MQRKRSRLRNFFDCSLLHLYFFSSGYGEKPLRALGVLVAFLTMACVSLAVFGLESVDLEVGYHGITSVQLYDPLSFDKIKAVIINVFKYVTFQRDVYLIPKTENGECIKVAAQTLIPIQAALLGVALRNRFRR